MYCTIAVNSALRFGVEFLDHRFVSVHKCLLEIVTAARAVLKSVYPAPPGLVARRLRRVHLLRIRSKWQLTGRMVAMDKCRYLCVTATWLLPTTAASICAGSGKRLSSPNLGPYFGLK